MRLCRGKGHILGGGSTLVFQPGVQSTPRSGTQGWGHSGIPGTSESGHSQVWDTGAGILRFQEFQIPRVCAFCGLGNSGGKGHFWGPGTPEYATPGSGVLQGPVHCDVIGTSSGALRSSGQSGFPESSEVKRTGDPEAPEFLAVFESWVLRGPEFHSSAGPGVPEQVLRGGAAGAAGTTRPSKPCARHFRQRAGAIECLLPAAGGAEAERGAGPAQPWTGSWGE